MTLATPAPCLPVAAGQMFEVMTEPLTQPTQAVCPQKLSTMAEWRPF